MTHKLISKYPKGKGYNSFPDYRNICNTFVKKVRERIDKLFEDSVGIHLKSECNFQSNEDAAVKMENLQKELNDISGKINIYEASNLELKVKVDKQIINIKQLNEKYMQMEQGLQEASTRIDKLSEDSVAIIAMSECHFLSIEDGARNIARLQTQFNDNGDKINKFGVANSEMKAKGDKQIIEIEKLAKKCSQVEQDGNKFVIRIDKISAETAAIASKIEDGVGKMGNLQMKLNEIVARQDKLDFGEFVWRIYNFSDKRKKAQNGIDTWIYSDPFHSHRNGYTMCLSMCPGGYGDGKGSHLSVFLHIMRGQFDNILQWPFKNDVTLALINQQTGIDHLSEIVKYDLLPNHVYWNKPIEDRNGGIGKPKFIQLDDVVNNAALYQSDTIFIKCIVHK